MTQPPPRQFSGIFISYRRDDSAGHTGRLYDRLAAHFGDDQVFMDIDQIEPGEDFVQIIEEAVGSCEILIAVIGRRWLTAGDETSRRLDNPNDFVRLEIAAALERDVRVIPVLVAGATMPGPQDLPAELAKLSRRNAVELSDLRWNHDIKQLIEVLDKLFARAEARRREAQETEERRRRAAEDEERRRQDEQQRRLGEAQAAQTAEEDRRRKVAEANRRRTANAQRGQTEEAAQREGGAGRQHPIERTLAIREIAKALMDFRRVRALPHPIGLSNRTAQAAIIAGAALGLVLAILGPPKWPTRAPDGNVASTVNQAQANTAASLNVNSQPGGREMITQMDVNLRVGPSISEVSIGRLEKGARVRVLRLEGAWAEIEIVERGNPRLDEGGATRGWINGRFLR